MIGTFPISDLKGTILGQMKMKTCTFDHQEVQCYVMPHNLKGELLLLSTVGKGMLIFYNYKYLNRELLLLSMTVSMGMLIFAGLGYALEKDEPDTMFYTLPQVLVLFWYWCWWYLHWY